MRAVNSVVTQLTSATELIIVVDGSTDNTLALLNQFDEQPGIHIIHQANSGPGPARNKGIQASVGRWVLPLDADDALEPGSVAHILGLLAIHPDTDCLIGGAKAKLLNGRIKHTRNRAVDNTPYERFCTFITSRKPRIFHGASVFRRDHLLTCPYSNLRQSEDICVFAFMVIQPNFLVTDYFLVQIYRQANSNSNAKYIPIADPELVTETVFENLPDMYQPLRQRFLTNRCLETARRLLREKRISDAQSLLERYDLPLFVLFKIWFYRIRTFHRR